MSHFFIKGIIRSLKLEAKIIFLDKAGFQLENSNYRIWRNYNEEIIGDGKNKLKERINLILAVNDSIIIHYRRIDKTVNHDTFIEFLEEMIDKIGKNNIKNYLIVMDNAKCNFHKEVKKFELKKS